MAKPRWYIPNSSYSNRKTHKPNREGLTWDEWAYAAGSPELGFCQPTVIEGRAKYPVLFPAWEAGEDPTEYRK